MRLKIRLGKNHRKKGGLRRFGLALPNSLIKTRLAVKIIRDGLKSKYDDGKSPIISPEYITRERLKIFYDCLKSVIKRHGHFNLVEMHSLDGTEILIRV